MSLIATTIAIACDHAGVALKTLVVAELRQMGAAVLDLGTDSDASVDYPDFAEKVAKSIISGKSQMGVLICGSGIGISIAANRFREVRAALCHSEETARLSRQHNNANVLVLGARIVDKPTAVACVHAFFTTPFEGGRHQKRVEKLS